MLITDGTQEWQHKGHVYGECMSHADSDLMYVYIPKNASSWTKPNLLDWGWEFYNYHTDDLNKHALVVLRDPVDRWLSGIAEYLTLYHKDRLISSDIAALIFDRVSFDDHTERQVKFLQGLDTDNCTFIKCDTDYRTNFSQFIGQRLGDNKYYNYAYQHVSESCPSRSKFKRLFQELIDANPSYLDNVRNYYAEDYKLIEQIEFYGKQV